MRQMAAFYRTPAGIKSLQVAPKVMQEGAELGQRRVQEHLPELQQLVKDSLAQPAASTAAPPGGTPPAAPPAAPH